MFEKEINKQKYGLSELVRLKGDLKRIAEHPNSVSKYRAIVQRRLESTGTDADGNKLRTDSSIRNGTMAYSPMYEEIRVDKGRQIRNVDLRWLGNYWKSKEPIVLNNFILFYDGDIVKDGGLISDNFKTSYSSPDEFIEATAGMNDIEADDWVNDAIIPAVNKRIDSILRMFK